MQGGEAEGKVKIEFRKPVRIEERVSIDKIQTSIPVTFGVSTQNPIPPKIEEPEILAPEILSNPESLLALPYRTVVVLQNPAPGKEETKSERE